MLFVSQISLTICCLLDNDLLPFAVEAEFIDDNLNAGFRKLWITTHTHTLSCCYLVISHSSRFMRVEAEASG